MLRPATLLVFTLLTLAAANAERLHSPWGDHKIVTSNAPYKCPDAPEFATTSDAEGYYSDSHYSVIDPVKKAAYDKASEASTHLGQYVGAAADAYLANASRPAAACVYSLLDAAAKANAWAGKMPHGQDVYNQNWMLSAASISYLKVRNSSAGSPKQDAEIQAWLHRVAERVQSYFDESKGHPKSDAYNNHIYWAGLSLAAEGIAGNDRTAFLWGIATYYQGAKAIQPDGSLKAEMDRASRALHYQLYALGPLVMLAELGEANGLDLYGVDHGAIHRLVHFNLAALEDPAIIANRTGVKQDFSPPPSGLEIGWALPYVKRFPDPQLSAMIAKAPWVRFWQWGGAPPEVQLPRPPLSHERSAFEANLQRTVSLAMREQFPADSSRSTAFLGVWCGQGDTSIRASIADDGLYLTLTNQNGDTSTGIVHGANSIVAPGWQGVIGTLTPKDAQIDWSNGSFWERCDAAKSDAGSLRLNLSGTWYPLGVASKPCSIRQHNDTLQIACKQVGHASGSIDADSHLTTNWNGTTITAIVSLNGNHINWDNQTYWTRATVYQSEDK
jgi:poly(beta-D-mannuronate) lyase